MQVDTLWLEEQAELTYERLLPRIEAAVTDVPDADLLLERLREHFSDAFMMFYQLYGGHYDFLYHLEATILTVIDAFQARSDELKALDAQRQANSDWFQNEQMIGAVGYVDRFAGDLNGIRRQIPYFEELGLTYLHLMPLFRCSTNSQ